MSEREPDLMNNEQQVWGRGTEELEMGSLEQKVFILIRHTSRSVASTVKTSRMKRLSGSSELLNTNI